MGRRGKKATGERQQQGIDIPLVMVDDRFAAHPLTVGCVCLCGVRSPTTTEEGAPGAGKLVFLFFQSVGEDVLSEASVDTRGIQSEDNKSKECQGIRL